MVQYKHSIRNVAVKKRTLMKVKIENSPNARKEIVRARKSREKSFQSNRFKNCYKEDTQMSKQKSIKSKLKMQTNFKA